MKRYNEFNLKEWIDYLENSQQQEIQLGLIRVKNVAETLDLLTPKAKVLSVAGTNGKGSTVATLEAIYHEAGYQVASYTSPHLLTFNERIKINKHPISDRLLCEAFTEIEKGRGKIPLTYFEMTTLAALWCFKQHELDIIILEVGLGGRLDATNIIDSDLAVITTIDLDHQAYLGETKEEIGSEKAGILRVGQFFVYADDNPPVTILNHAKTLNTRAYYYGKDYTYLLSETKIRLNFQGEQIELPKPNLHPNSVIAAVIASILLREELDVSQQDWEGALNTVFLSGRLQIVRKKATLLFDVAHNPQAAIYLAEFIKKFYPTRKVHAVFSALKDKDIPGLIAPLMNAVDFWYPTLLGVKRGAYETQLLDAFRQYNTQVLCYSNPLEAYQSASRQADEGDLIVVYGSFITVGEVMSVVYNSGYVDKRLV